MAQPSNAAVSRASDDSWRGLQPYRQGAFDGLCGLYATVNAIRLVCDDADTGSQRIWTDLFDMLVRATEKRVGSVRATLIGIKTKPSQQIIVDVIGELATSYGFRLRLVDPLEHPHASATALREWLNWTLEARDTAVIIKIFRPSPHWTVLREFDEERLYLFDSAGIRTLETGGGRRRVAGPMGLIDPLSAIVLERRT